MPRTLLCCAAVALAGCISTQDRPMNHGEQTMVSDDVRTLVEESKDGQIDTREFPDIRCRRFKLVGTHMVTRYCYSAREEEEALAENQDKMRDRWGKLKCLDRTVGGACNQN